MSGNCLILVILVMCISIKIIDSSCTFLNNCSGHGKCGLDSTCICYPGWGAPSDISDVKAVDCSLRVCPASHSMSWTSVADYGDDVHMKMSECGGMGDCDRATGQCVCNEGFYGTACERQYCPNDCSGHGRCLSMARLAVIANISVEYGRIPSNGTWDAHSVYGCLCDSSWSVGFGAGQTQLSEWFGGDCSQKRCPSADNPRTAINELDCYNITQVVGSNVYGQAGNLCHIDCANNGVCDYDTGTCTCFPGAYGTACDVYETLPEKNITAALFSTSLEESYP